MVIISHLHDDHIDPIAESLLPNNITILSQPEDESEIEAKGFCNLIPVADTISWKGISIPRDWGTFVLNVQNYSCLIMRESYTMISVKRPDNL